MSMTRGSFLRFLLTTPFIPGFVKESAAEELHQTGWKPEKIPASGNELMRINWMAPTYHDEILYEHAGPPDRVYIQEPGLVNVVRQMDIFREMIVTGSVMNLDILGEEVHRFRQFLSSKYLYYGDTLEVTHHLYVSGWMDDER